MGQEGASGGGVNFDAYGKRALIRVLKRLRSRQVDDGYETYIDKIIPMMVHSLLPLRRCLNLLAKRSFGHMVDSERTVGSFVLILNPGIRLQRM